MSILNGLLLINNYLTHGFIVDTLQEYVASIKEFYNKMPVFLQESLHYNLHAGLFDDNETYELALKRTTEELVAPLQLNTKKVLDVGCGLGMPSLEVFKKYDCDLTGITISEKQCEQANNLLNSSGLDPSRIRFQLMDAHQLEYPDATFDSIYALESLNYMNKALVLAECFRVLKSQGSISICDYCLKEKVNRLGLSILNKFLYNYRFVEDIKNLFFEVGFIDIQICDWSQKIIPNYKHWRRLIFYGLKYRHCSLKDALKIFLVTELFKRKSGYFLLYAKKP